MVLVSNTGQEKQSSPYPEKKEGFMTGKLSGPDYANTPKIGGDRFADVRQILHLCGRLSEKAPLNWFTLTLYMYE